MLRRAGEKETLFQKKKRGGGLFEESEVAAEVPGGISQTFRKNNIRHSKVADLMVDTRAIITFLIFLHGSRVLSDCFHECFLNAFKKNVSVTVFMVLQRGALKFFHHLLFDS